MKILRNLLFFLFISTAVNAQQLGVWKNYSNLQKITDAYVTEKGVWAACQGGAFFYSFEDNSFIILNKAEGLSNNLLTSVTLDSQGKVWLGSDNGSIDVYNPSTKEFKRILEIANTNRLSKSINELYAKGDTIFASTNFGLSLINSNTLSFYESCTKFGNFNTDSKVNSSFKDNMIYACTPFGIAVQKSLFSNFSAPESWNTYPSSLFLSASTTNQIVKYRDTLITSTDKGLFYFNGTTWLPITSLNSVNVLDLMVRNDSLFVISNDNRIIIYSHGIISTPFPKNSYKKFAQTSLQNQFFVITDNGLLNLNNRSSAEYIFPNGPKANLFSDMAVDKNGNLFVASGTSDIYGYYKFDGNSWSNFSTQNNPALKQNAIFKVYYAPDNTLYMETWGNGFIRIREHDTTVFNAQNTKMIGIPKDLNYVVIFGLRADSKGNLWMVNFWSQARQPLNRLSTDSVWTYFINPLDPKDVLARDLVIDNNDTKWFTVGPPPEGSAQYLYYFNGDNPLYTSDINGWGRITSDDGLSQATLNCMAVGRRGELWIGTGDGVNVIEDPSQPKGHVTSVYIMRTQNIKCMAVDALNQKWVGTDKGLFVLSSDGTRLIANYTIDNSPLPSNSISSLAFDNNSGVVYIGTDIGLASVVTNSINPQENLSNMYVYPNPVILDKNKPVNINVNGLVRDSEIKIFTTSGKLVIDFPSPGAGMATWDGRDDSGNLVPSGVYLVVAFDKEGNNVGSTKVAIIKK